MRYDCRVCGGPLPIGHRSLCARPACRRLANRRLWADLVERRTGRRPSLEPGHCQVCGRPIEGRRVDAQVCLSIDCQWEAERRYALAWYHARHDAVCA